MNSSKLVKSVAGIFTVAILVSGFTSSLAFAKKMGGGMSMGRQSSSVFRNQNSLPPKPTPAPVASNPASSAKPTPAAPAPAAPAAPAPQPSRFGGLGGILGGVAAGIGLSYLFSHMGLGGMGEGLASMFSGILMIAILAFVGMFLYRKFAGKSNNMMTPSMAGMPGSPSSNNSWNANEMQAAKNEPTFQSVPVQAVPMATSNQLPLINEQTQSLPIQADLTPSNFSDKESFLNNAKSLFVQLQEASDQQNLETLKEYTTPEFFNLLRQDMLSRTSAIQFTQVLTLAADLIAVEDDGKEYLASVRFSGTIREEKDGPIESFEEVWNWVKPIHGQVGWLLCGIQQLN